MSDWINVKDQLPMLYEFVLVYANNKGTGEPKPISIAKIIRKDKWEFVNHMPCMTNYGAWTDMEYAMDSDDITHWMPLPEAPTEQKKMP